MVWHMFGVLPKPAGSRWVGLIEKDWLEMAGEGMGMKIVRIRGGEGYVYGRGGTKSAVYNGQREKVGERTLS